jgi:hypothetical protein
MDLPAATGGIKMGPRRETPVRDTTFDERFAFNRQRFTGWAWPTFSFAAACAGLRSMAVGR